MDSQARLESLNPVCPHPPNIERRRTERLGNPINPGNRKILLFTAFADTADYLCDCIAADQLKRYGLHTGKITGTTGPKTTIGKGYDFQDVMTLFSPRSKEKAFIMPKEIHEIDLVIGTDCISEGQNLQNCDYLNNYDIHWNPVCIIQRFGRIDRIGSTNAQIQLVNYWPDISLDEYINLKERVENRMVIEMEGLKTGISITDLGLNDFRMDLAVPNNSGSLRHPSRGRFPGPPPRMPPEDRRPRRRSRRSSAAPADRP
jgi:ERCC4-related helicase